MVNYLSKFINNLSNESKNLRELDKKGIKWIWTEKHEETFKKLKKMISDVKTLRYFDPQLPI